MKKFLLALAAAGISATTMVAPVSAQSASFSFSFGPQERFVSQQCDRHPNWRGCRDFRRDHRHWSRNDYRNWYLSNRPGLGGLGLGLFAFALGAAAASSAARAADADDDWQRHVEACYDRYRSYDERTDMYLSYNNGYQRCRL